MTKSNNKTNRNIAIVAHVDAGKTTVSERILFAAREINACGEVDEGLATMDYLADEKEKGITIETGIHSFTWKNAPFSFLDTPGHIDFSAEVDQSLDASDMGVVVVSGVRGIEARTVSLWNLLASHKVPYMFFINKLDQSGVDLDYLLVELEERCSRSVLCMSYPWYQSGVLVGSIDVLNNCLVKKDEYDKETVIEKIPEEWQSTRDRFYKEIVEAASEIDDDIAELYFEDKEIPTNKLIKSIAQSFNQENYVLAYLGSAIQNIGIRQLTTAMHLFAQKREKSYSQELGKIIQYRLNDGLGYYIFKSFIDSKIDEISSIPSNIKFFKIKAEQFSVTDSLRDNSIYALQQSIDDINSHESFRPGDVLDLNGVVVRNIWEGSYQPLIQTRIEAASYQDVDLLKNILNKADVADPALKVEYSEAGGNWILHTVGEVHRDVWLKRLKRDYKCSFSTGSPEPERYECLKENLHNYHISSKSEAFQADLKLDFIKSPDENPDVIIEVPIDDLCREVIVDTVDQANHGSVLGFGSLAYTQCVVKNLEIHTRVIPGLLKKLLLDAYNMALTPNNMLVIEPLMLIEINVPQEFCGKIVSDLESREAKIVNLDSDGYASIIKAEVFLDKVFGYSMELRSISMGSATYTMTYLSHEKKISKS